MSRVAKVDDPLPRGLKRPRRRAAGKGPLANAGEMLGRVKGALRAACVCLGRGDVPGAQGKVADAERGLEAVVKLLRGVAS